MHLVQKKMTLKEDVLYSNVKKNGRELERYKKLNMERDFHCLSEER